MKLQATLAALVLASLPIVGQASVASEDALQANHQPLAGDSAPATQSAKIDDFRTDGVSTAMAKQQSTIIALSDHQTNLPSDDNQQETSIGHAVDW